MWSMHIQIPEEMSNNKDIHALSFYECYPDKSYIEVDDRRSVIVLKEKGERRKYQANNNSHEQVIVYRIDGGVIRKDSELKCDYALLTESNTLYLVELKGADYDHAVRQILNTIKLLKPDVKTLNARVVLSKVKTPNILSTDEKQLTRILRQRKGTLQRAVNILVENIS